MLAIRMTRHGAKIKDTGTLQEQVDLLRNACGAQPRRAALSQDRHRQPGGLNLRVQAPAVATALAPDALGDKDEDEDEHEDVLREIPVDGTLPGSAAEATAGS